MSNKELRRMVSSQINDMIKETRLMHIAIGELLRRLIDAARGESK